jgi:predicted nucleic acid-binding protein
MILVDSSVWIDFFNGKDNRPTRFLRELLDREFLAVGDLIVTEVLQGFRRDAAVQEAANLFSQLPCYELSDCELAHRSAQNYRRLRVRGLTVRKTIDVIIATFCIAHGHTLLHSDRDFDLMREPLGLVTL